MRLGLSLALMSVLSSGPLASAQTAVTIRGVVVGHDGKPMRGGIAALSTAAGSSEKQSLDAQGRFSFSVSSPGAYTLFAAGVFHRTLFTPVFVETPGTVEVNVRLATSEYRKELTDLRVIGEFNKFSTDSGGIPMERQPDGSFTATVEWKGDRLAYQVQGVLDGTDPICGTQADSFERDMAWPFFDDGNNQFVSVIRVTGDRARVVFDPGQLPHSTSAPDVQFAAPSGLTAWIAATDWQFKQENRRISAAMEAHVRAGNRPEAFNYDSTEWRRKVEQWVQQEREPLRRQYLMLRYFAYPGAKTNVELAKKALTETPPTSAAWSLLWGGPENTFTEIAKVAKLPEEDAYVAAAWQTNSDPNVRAAFLYMALQKASSKNDANAVGRLYTQLMGDYGTTGYAKRAISDGTIT